MRVTAIEPSGNLYGSEFALLDVISATRTNVEWDVLLPHGSSLTRLLEDAGIRHREILDRDTHELSLPRKAPAYLRMRRHFSRQRPDLIYLNQAGMLRAVCAVSRGLRTPLVCQVQTLEDARLVAANPQYHERVTSFISNSRFIARECGVPAEKLSVFFQPVLGDSRPVSSPPRIGNGWRIGIVGRIAETKGHWVFLEAAKKLIDSGSRDVRFVVIGEGIDADTTARFRQAVSAAGMSEHVDLRGYRTDIMAELAALHIVSIPSLAEPLGRVLLDACVAGRPAILSESGGLGEFSRHFDIGRRVPAGDASALAAGWTSMMDDYANEHRRFVDAASSALSRLDPGSYGDVMGKLLTRARGFKPSAFEWLGSPA